MDEAPAAHLTAEQACQQLNLAPATLRQLLREYRDVLPTPEADGAYRLSPADVRRLATIARLRAEGWDPAAIRAALLAGGESEARVPADASADHPMVWRAALERLDRLAEALAAMDRRWREDRDRLVMMILRLQQEVQALRYELAAAGGRRPR